MSFHANRNPSTMVYPNFIEKRISIIFRTHSIGRQMILRFFSGKNIYKMRNKASRSLLWQILRQRQRLFLLTDCPHHCCELQDRKTVASVTGKHNINKSSCWYFGKSLDFHEIHLLVANTLNFSEETHSWSYSSRPLCRSSEHCLFWNYKFSLSRTD